MKLLTVKEIAGTLKVDEEVVRRWLRSGKLRGVKLAGDTWRVNETELDKFIKGEG